MRRALVVLSLSAALLVVGCGTPAAPLSGTPGTTPVAVRPVSACVPAARALMSAISHGLDIAGTGGGLRNGYTVKSGDYVKLWFVGAEIVGEGIGPGEAVGIWATNDLNAGGLIFAVDGFANEFSDWGDGTKTDAQMSMFDDGAQEAKACAEQAAR